jgi:hypothetical protein
MGISLKETLLNLLNTFTCPERNVEAILDRNDLLLLWAHLFLKFLSHVFVT